MAAPLEDYVLLHLQTGPLVSRNDSADRLCFTRCESPCCLELSWNRRSRSATVGSSHPAPPPISLPRFGVWASNCLGMGHRYGFQPVGMGLPSLLRGVKELDETIEMHQQLSSPPQTEFCVGAGGSAARREPATGRWKEGFRNGIRLRSALATPPRGTRTTSQPRTRTSARTSCLAKCLQFWSSPNTSKRAF